MLSFSFVVRASRAGAEAGLEREDAQEQPRGKRGVLPGQNIFNVTSTTKTLCPSGLRGWTQVPLARAAWAQIPQVSWPPSTLLAPQAGRKAFKQMSVGSSPTAMGPTLSRPQQAAAPLTRPTALSFGAVGALRQPPCPRLDCRRAPPLPQGGSCAEALSELRRAFGTWPVGLMDKVSASGAGDSRLEPLAGRPFEQ